MSDSERITVTDKGAAMLAADQRARPVDLLFPGRRAAIAAGVCMSCGGRADRFRDQLSRKEHGISGLCQDCQDEVFA